jgi:hypothetical protein
MLVSSWEPYRLALETTAVVDAAAASLWLDPKTQDDAGLLTQGFTRVFGKKVAAWCARTALAADVHPFSGYARWEINDRWDVSASSVDQDGRENEVALFSRLERRTTALPPAFAASLSFRAYLARRDLFVHRAAQGVWQLRRALNSKPRDFRLLLVKLDQEAKLFSRSLSAGRRAARVMWRRSRAADATSQNEVILARDATRLRSWRLWLRACGRWAPSVFERTPVSGAWQLIFTVVNFAPALQRVSVEQQQPDGHWRDLHDRYTIEFQALAAKPRAHVRRLFSTPIDEPNLPLRLVLRGLGEVRIEQPVMTNGLQTREAAGPVRFRLGRTAPQEGFPDVTQRLQEVLLSFAAQR